MARRGADAVKARLQQQAASAQREAEVDLGEPTRPRPGQMVLEVPIAAIAPNRNNPRKDTGDLADLAASITDHGVLQPITVRPLQDGEAIHYPEGTRYLLLMGERRWAASQLAGRDTVPVIVRDDLSASERQVMILENVLRKELTPVEEAKAFKELLDTGLSQRELARQLQMTQPHISRRLSLLNLSPGLLAMVDSGVLGVDVAATEVSKLTETAQGYVLDKLTIDAESPLGITPETVRRHMATAQAEADRLERIASQRRWLDDYGMDTYADSWALRSEADQRGMTAIYLGSASEVDDLADVVGVINPLTNEPDLYRLTNPVPVTQPVPSETVEDGLDEAAGPREEVDSPDEDRDLFDQPVVTYKKPLGDDERKWKKLNQAITAWVAANPKPPAKSQLAQRLAEHVVATAHFDPLWMVCKWVNGRVGCEIKNRDDFYRWKSSLQPKDALTVAWLVTVATETAGLRYSTEHGDAWQATRARVVEVAPELLAELDMEDEK